MDNHFLAIAINEYPHIPQHSLHGPKKDVEAIADILQSSYGFNKITILESPSDDPKKIANLSNVSQAIGRFTTLNDDSNLIIYFAGHGRYVSSSNSGYWLCNDVDDFSNSDGGRGYYHNAALLGVLENCSGLRHILLISDSCFAGSLLQTRDIQEQKLDVSSIIDGFKSREVLASCGMNVDRTYQIADDNSMNGHSMFAYWLLEFLRNPGMQSFYTSHIFDYLMKNMGTFQIPALGYLRNHDFARNATYVFHNQKPVSVPIPETVHQQPQPQPVVEKKKTTDWDSLMDEYSTIVYKGLSFATLIHRHPSLIDQIKESDEKDLEVTFFKALAHEHGFLGKKPTSQLEEAYRTVARSEGNPALGWYQFGNMLETVDTSLNELFEAYDAYIRSSSLGFAPASFRAGLLALSGRLGINKQQDGLRLIKDASRNGCLMATQVLSRLEDTGKSVGKRRGKDSSASTIKDVSLDRRIETLRERFDSLRTL